ncbi:hypothetical protein DSL72_003186 [Monilinia vaccinii-corymbosi]|uniref:Uncharacterized protein n=1 Tax=Monilinia vaccinii-corymbosi TaxID=61207 RepID=A0A8A3P0I1_9HELO|nr:hypothetical protein DSL72_003186 [Monilinia vaccinii-corymbosi]
MGNKKTDELDRVGCASVCLQRDHSLIEAAQGKPISGVPQMETWLLDNRASRTSIAKSHTA